MLVIDRKLIIIVHVEITSTMMAEYLWKLVICLVLKVKVNASTTIIPNSSSSSSNVPSTTTVSTTATKANKVCRQGHLLGHVLIAAAITGIEIVENNLLGSTIWISVSKICLWPILMLRRRLRIPTGKLLLEASKIYAIGALANEQLPG